MVTGGKQYLPGAITDEQYQAWLEYQKAGGILEFYEWLDGGMPTITEEQANIAWMQRLDAYLTNQLNSGNISESEAKVIGNDTRDRLFGQGTYAGDRKNFNQLPAAILSDVERYWTGLPIAAQKEAEAAARVESQRLQDIASQRVQLPLGAGGTQTQQINAGMLAIQNLRTQMAAAPSYLQDEMRTQIAQLEDSINQISSSVRLQARQTTKAKEGIPEEPPEPGTMAQMFAKQYGGITPKGAQLMGFNYNANPESPLYADLTSEQKGQLAWVGMEAAGPPPQPAPVPPYNPPAEFTASGETGSPVWKSWFARYYPSIVSQFTQGEGGKRTAESWSGFLAKERTRLKEQFASQGAYSRAERPSYYQSKLKTVAF